MSAQICDRFAQTVKLSPSELASLKCLLATDHSLADKLSEHLAYVAKRPGVTEAIRKQWIAKLPAAPTAQPVATAAPPALSQDAPPPIAQAETFSHAAIGGQSVPGNWTMDSASQAGASMVWRSGLPAWQPVGQILGVQPAAKPVVPMIDGFSIPWPQSVELAKNGKFYANLRGSLKAMGKGEIGVELEMLRALLGDDSQYRAAILAEVNRLVG